MAINEARKKVHRRGLTQQMDQQQPAAATGTSCDDFSDGAFRQTSAKRRVQPGPTGWPALARFRRQLVRPRAQARELVPKELAQLENVDREHIAIFLNVYPKRKERRQCVNWSGMGDGK